MTERAIGIVRRTELAFRIADEAAMSIIESECSDFHLEDGHAWRNKSDVLDIAQEDVERAIEYMDLSGEIVHHPSRPELFRLKGVGD